MACSPVYKTYINCGVDDIVLSFGLTPAAVYNVAIETPTGSKYFFEKTVDAFGDITLPISDFPAALFNPYAGPFVVGIEEGCDQLILCDYYGYIQFEVLNGNQAKNTLTCCAPSDVTPSGSACCTTVTTTFTDEAVTVLPYTGVRPSIEVAYLNLDGTYTLQGISTTITFDGTAFTIDHGGASSGLIKTMK